MTSKKTFLAALSALAIGGTLLASAAPAEARSWHRHHGGAVAVGVLGGLALAGAAAAATAPVYVAPVYAGPYCRSVSQPVYNAFGHFLYYRTVRYCG